MAKTKTPKTGLTKKHWIGYALGDFGGCMTFALMGSFVTRYYTNVLQVNTVVLAVLLAIWNIWDAVNDPMMGALMDKMFAKKRHPKGKFRPWLLRATPMLAVTSIAFWTVPTFFEGTAMICVLFVCKILYEACYTMFNIPMGSLLSAMANTDEERASLSSARGFGGMIGNMIPAMIFPVFLNMYGDSNATGYGIGATVCAVIGAVICFGHYAWTEERNIVDTPAEAADDIKFTDILNVFKVNRAFLALCIHGVCICTMQYVSSTLGTYMYADVLGNVSLMSFTSILSMPMMIVILIVAPKLARKMGLIPLIRHSLLIGFVLYMGLFAMHMFTDVNPWVHMIWSSLASGIGMVSIQMQWGMVGEAIDYNEYLTGKRTEGSIYGTFNLTRRIGQTIGNSAAVLALGWIGYDTALAAAGGVQAASVLTGIKVLCVLVPGIFLIGSWAAFKYVWNITPEIRAEMHAAKEAKAKKIAE
ncbi:MAG: MFS transporter [Oscillospiraceae bacterium]|nr:MFS transporter [Oscillospiraceae bacterium]